MFFIIIIICKKLQLLAGDFYFQIVPAIPQSHLFVKKCPWETENNLFFFYIMIQIYYTGGDSNFTV